jgi:diguanylate cyclase (GGDEF)-like protein/PAS domain S-box-containing protein
MTKPASILIVDDDGGNRRLLQALLGPEGYVTGAVASGEEALTRIAADPPDLILLDVMMPGLDGRQVARAVKAEPATSNIPIIMVTAQTDRDARLAALEAGAEDFLSKPVDCAELWLRVRNLLHLKELNDLLEQHQETLEAQVKERTAELQERTDELQERTDDLQESTAELQERTTELQERTADLQERTADLQRFRTAMDVTDDAITLVNRTTMAFLEVNAAAAQMMGYSREELLELGPMDLVGAPRLQLEALYDAVIAGHGQTDSIESAHRRDGYDIPTEVHRHAHRVGDDWIIVEVSRDITERVEAQSRLQHLAHFDALTGLLNRALFRETLTKTLVVASARGQGVAVLLMDLDHFKDVNDTYGHGIGDELLIQVSDRLISCVRVRDTLGRLGGDEFALILTMPEGQHDAAAVVAREIQSALLEPFDLFGREVSVTASIGITLFPDDASDTESLLKYADTAMYQAKQGGRDGFQFFTSAMNTEVWRRLELDTALRAAVKNGEFVLHYQPKVQITGRAVVGLEALLRWERPGYGLVMPSEFIYALEDCGLIDEVGRWVIGAACAQIREWIQDGIEPVQVSVNVSSQQFHEGNLKRDVLVALDTYQVPAHLLELELTEAMLMTSPDSTVNTLADLKAVGVDISIDDFGTGFSSLAYLRRFPVDKLKIDLSFIRDIAYSSDSAAASMTLAIIQMGHSLNLTVIAEGVETKPQLAYLRRHGCDQIQGYYFSRPHLASELEPLLRARTNLPAPGTDPALSRRNLLQRTLPENLTHRFG